MGAVLAGLDVLRLLVAGAEDRVHGVQMVGHPVDGHVVPVADDMDLGEIAGIGPDREHIAVHQLVRGVVAAGDGRAAIRQLL